MKGAVIKLTPAFSQTELAKQIWKNLRAMLICSITPPDLARAQMRLRTT